MTKRCDIQVLCFFYLILSSVASCFGAAEGQIKAENTDLERFIPPNGNTVYNAAGLLRSWPSEGPEELWRRDSLDGHSAVVEARGRAFTMAQIEEKQYGICLDPLTGKILWKVLLIPKKNTHNMPGPVTSPVVDGDRIYFVPYDNESSIFRPHCPVICVRSDGTELWRENENVWVTEGSTPLVVGDTLYVAATHPDTIFMAVDKMTGKRLWATEYTLPEEDFRGKKWGAFASAASVTYQEVGGIPQLISAVCYSHEVIGIHAGSGELMWCRALPSRPNCGLISTPVAMGKRLFLTAADGPDCFSVCLEMETKDGKLVPREVYRSDTLQCNNFNTVAVYEGAVFGFGSGTESQALQCTNFADGKLLWQNESSDWDRRGQLIIADGLIFALTRKGQVVLLEASRTGFKELGRVDPKVKMLLKQQPTLANGRLYIRGENTIVCYQVAQEKSP